MAEMMEWIYANVNTLWWIAVLSALAFVVGIIGAPMWIVRLPADYFSLQRELRRQQEQNQTPEFLIKLLRNIAGSCLVLVGIAMLVLPGPGIVAILAGCLMMEFRGKMKLLRWFVSRPPIRRSVNWMRIRAGRPPLQMDEMDTAASGAGK